MSYNIIQKKNHAETDKLFKKEKVIGISIHSIIILYLRNSIILCTLQCCPQRKDFLCICVNESQCNLLEILHEETLVVVVVVSRLGERFYLVRTIEAMLCCIHVNFVFYCRSKSTKKRFPFLSCFYSF